MRLLLPALALLALACDRRAPPKEPPLPPKPSQPLVEARMERDLEALAREAGIEPSDPPAPPGSLREEVEGFESLDACTGRLATVDPLLGDALDAIGYEGLVRDACRLLEALATRDPKKCAPILASPLRARCEADVATLVGDPNLCPQSAAGRDPLCLARARRDPRLCTAVPEAERARCVALVSGNEAHCAKDTTCSRQVRRWTSLFAPPSNEEPFPASLQVRAWESARTVDATPRHHFELDALAARGVVLRKRAGGLELRFGNPRDASWLPADMPSAKPRAFFSLKVPPGDETSAIVSLDSPGTRFELLLPGFASLSNVAGTTGAFTIADLSPEPGGLVRLDLQASFSKDGRRYSIAARLETYVRDVEDR